MASVEFIGTLFRSRAQVKLAGLITSPLYDSTWNGRAYDGAPRIQVGMHVAVCREDEVEGSARFKRQRKLMMIVEQPTGRDDMRRFSQPCLDRWKMLIQKVIVGYEYVCLEIKTGVHDVLVGPEGDAECAARTDFVELSNGGGTIGSNFIVNNDIHAHMPLP